MHAASFLYMDIKYSIDFCPKYLPGHVLLLIWTNFCKMHIKFNDSPQWRIQNEEPLYFGWPTRAPKWVVKWVEKLVGIVKKIYGQRIRTYCRQTHIFCYRPICALCLCDISFGFFGLGIYSSVQNYRTKKILILKNVINCDLREFKLILFSIYYLLVSHCFLGFSTACILKK